MKHLLVVANDFPYPPTHGAAVDMWNRILMLKKMGYHVHLLASIRKTPERDSIETVRKEVENLWLIPRETGIGSILSLRPFQVQSRKGLATAEIGNHFDAVILEADYVAPFLENPAANGAKRILRIHNEQVRYFKDLSQGAKSWSKKLYFSSESFKFRSFSQSVMRKCDLLWFISDSEREAHVQRYPQDAGKSFFLPTHVSPADLRPFAGGGKNALFVGSLTISHNLDSVVWYIENVHELLSDLLGYTFKVAGRTAGHSIDALRNLIQSTGRAALEENPETLDDLYLHAGVFVNPVIRGAGIKVKVVEAIKAGLPVVSTSLGIEGTGFRDSIHLLVGDTPHAFADCVRRVLIEPGLAESLVSAAQAFIRQRYDMKENMEKTLSHVLAANG